MSVRMARAPERIHRGRQPIPSSSGRSLAVCAVACLLLFLLVFAGAPAQAQQDAERNAIAVVLDDNYPPYIFRDKTGRVQGILVDEWKLWEKKTGISVDLMPMDWGKAQQIMREGKADVIDTIFYSDERAKFYDFSKPYARLDVPVFVHKDLGGITDIASLQGFTVGVKSGDASADVLKSHGIFTLREFNSYEEIVQAAAEHKIRVFTVDKPPALYYLYKLNIEDEFRTAFSLGSGEFHRAVRKGNAALLRRIEDGFAAISASEHAAIEEKWLGEPLVSQTHLRYAFLSLLAVIGVVAVLVLFNIALRRKVMEKTNALNTLVAELSQSEEKYRSLVDNLNLGVYRCTPGQDARFLQINPAMALMFGYEEPAALMQTPFAALCQAPEELEALFQTIERHGVVESAILRFLKKDGCPALVSINSRGHKDLNGTLLWCDGVIKDVTERTRVQDALLRRHRELTILNSISKKTSESLDLSIILLHAQEVIREALAVDAIGVYLLDAQGERLELHSSFGFSPATLEILRHRRLGEGVAGKALADRTAMTLAIDDAAPTPGLRALHRDKFKTMSSIPIMTGNKPVGAINMAFRAARELDEDEMRLLQTIAQQLGVAIQNGKLFESLTAELAQRTKAEEELRTAKEAAEAANQAKSEFLANMSHELRTPLNGVLGMLQLIKRGSFDPALERYVDVALVSGNSLVKIINDILDLSRIEKGMIDLRFAPMRLEEVILTVLGGLEVEASKKGVDLGCEIDKEIPAEVVGDAQRIRQILFNLVGNAIKFTKQGAVRIHVSLVSRQAETFHLLFRITDTGIGIPEEKLGWIFEPFAQVDGSLTRRYGGVGLGLSIVKRLVGAMGGRIGVESQLGQGTTFEFTVAVKTAPTQLSGAQPALAGASPASKARVLVVEDDRISQLTLTLFLENLGYKASVAGNGQEALEALQRERFDAVLMDIQMPVMDGLEATRRIRKEGAGKSDPTLPIIALTAHAMSGDREMFLAAGMDDYLAKPVEMVDLGRVLEKALAAGGGERGQKKGHCHQRCYPS